MANQAKGETTRPPTGKLMSFREFTEAKKTGGVPASVQMRTKTKFRRSKLAKTIIKTLREAAAGRRAVGEEG